LPVKNAIIYIAGKDPTVQMGGHSSYVRAHARAALRLGYEPHIFCLHAESGVSEHDFGFVHRIGTRRRITRTATVPLDALALARPILNHIGMSRGPHLLHGFGLWGYTGVQVCRRLVAQGASAVAVNSIYTTVAHEFRAKLAGAIAANDIGTLIRRSIDYPWALTALQVCERTIIRGSQLLISNYRSVQRMVEARYGRELPIRLIPYCSEYAFLRNREDRPAAPVELESFADSGAPLIVSVSRHDPRKGLATLLRALAELRSAGVRFRACLVSGGELIEAHRRLSVRLGLSDCVMITGWVDDPFAFLTHADIFALPSDQEGSGSVALLEALQAARPAVVASEIDGIVEDVANGQSALLVTPGDDCALAAALRRLIEDAALRKRLAFDGHRIYRERFSAEAMTSALEDLYSNLGFPPPAQSNARDLSLSSADKR
jgi:glycosyltransferase involved in cell wall biosynthesis